MDEPLTIAVLKGGISSEREVSLKSGAAVTRGLRTAGYDVIPVDVRDSELRELDTLPIDVAFIALHGTFGEDGGVQMLLENKGIPYTGSGVSASELAMDKLASKDMFVFHGVNTPSYVAVPEGESLSEHAVWVDKVGYPLVVKPPREGSSMGASIVRREGDVAPAFRSCYRFDDEALVEQFIQGRELTVGVIDHEPLPIIEIKTSREFYDYNAKYHAPDTQYILDPDLEPELAEEIKEMASRAFDALGCEGFGRVDFMLGLDGVPYVLEINTIPGFTERSLLPKAAAHAGIGFPQLCGRLARMALVTQRDQAAAAAD